MTTRFKLIAAALGLVVATGAIGDASARTIVRTVAHTTKTVRIVTHRPHRVHIGTRLVEHVRLIHRAPLRPAGVVIGARPIVAPVVVAPVVAAKTVVGRPLATRIVGTKIVATRIVRAHAFVRSRIVHVAKRPLVERHAMNHHAGRSTFIR